MTHEETSSDSLDHEQAVKYGRLSVAVLGLSVRPSNCLQRDGVKTIADLLSYKPADLMVLQNFGVTSLDEIEKKLEKRGLALATEANQKQRQSAAAQPIEQGGTSEVDESILAAPIDVLLSVDVLGLSVRPSKCLQRAGVKTIADLLTCKPADLMVLRNFGVTALDEIELALEEQGLSLATVENQKQRQSAAAQLIAPGGTSEVAESHPLENKYPLRTRSFNALTGAGISTVEELAAMSKEELLALPNFGPTSLDDVTKCLDKYGLRLSSKPTPRRRQRFLTSSVKETLWPMFEEGLKIPQVAKRTDLSSADVSFARLIWTRNRPDSRVETMLELREAGWTLKEIGDQIGVTRERVRQILNKAGAVTAQELSERKRLKREEETESAAAAMRAQVRANPGTTLKAVAEQLGVDLATVRRALTTAEMKLIVKVDGRSASDASKKWSRQAMLDLLKVAATYSWPVTVNSYNALIEVGEIDGPSSQLFPNRFGSWTEACAAAGVESGTTFPDGYNRAWTEEDLWRYVCNYLLDPATKGTLHDFDSWLAGKDGAPSGPYFRLRLGGWQEMKPGAIKRLVASGELKEHGLID